MEKISVIVPVYNSHKHIKECLDSIINQTYKNIEILVINDKSTDNSLEIINSFKDKRIKIINLKKNSGVAVARNKGIEEATGNYICFIDSDDYWYPEKLKKQIKFIKNNNYAFIYSDYEFLSSKRKHRAIVPKSITYKQALKNTTIFTSTVMFNMHILNKEDIYMPLIKRGQDTACWWQVLKKGITAYGINEVLSVYRIHQKSLSHDKLTELKRKWHLYKRENIQFFKRCYYFICYVKNAIKRRI